MNELTLHTISHVCLVLIFVANMVNIERLYSKVKKLEKVNDERDRQEFEDWIESQQIKTSPRKTKPENVKAKIKKSRPSTAARHQFVKKS